LSAQYGLGIQRQPACCLPHRLLTHHAISPPYDFTRPKPQTTR
jgi:hypothetical protein